MKFQPIESSSNDKIKNLRKLGQKKHRNVSETFLVENITTIHDALNKGITPISLFVTDALAESPSAQLTAITEQLPTSALFSIPSRLLSEVSSLDTAPGVMAIYAFKKDIIDTSASIIYLNSVSDPGNMGTIIRTAAAFGIKTVVLDERCVDAYNPKTVQAAKDALFSVNIIRDTAQKQLKKIKKEMPLIAATLSGTPLNDHQFTTPSCIILGSESHGIANEILEEATTQITIPIQGIESLNVAIAGAIISYELSK